MTTYYVRTIADNFDFNISDSSQTHGYSLTSHFEMYNEPALGATFENWGHRTNRMFSTENQVLYAFFANDNNANLTNRISPPTRTSITSSNVLVQSGTTGTIYWCTRRRNDELLNRFSWQETNWSTRGWSTPYLSGFSTFVNQLCTAFNNLNVNSVVTNNSNINLVVFKYRFTNEPVTDQYYYFPVFYVGNDPNYDSTVVI